MNTTKPTAPTSDRWIKADNNQTVILTALTRITCIICFANEVRIYCHDDFNCIAFTAPAEAEVFRDELLAKIDRL